MTKELDKKDFMTFLQALAGGFVNEKLEEHKDIYEDIEAAYKRGPAEFLDNVEDAIRDFQTLVQEAMDVPEERESLAYFIATGVYEDFHKRRIVKLEGSPCSADKSNFIKRRTFEAITTNTNLSLFDDYQDSPQITEDKERQAYWSPTSVSTTDEAIKLFWDWYNGVGPIEDELLKTIKALYKAMKDAKAGNVHFVLHNPFSDPNVAAAISVYEKEKPSHIVMEELEEWLEAEGHTEVLDKIQELATDMSFMQDANLVVPDEEA